MKIPAILLSACALAALTINVTPVAASNQLSIKQCSKSGCKSMSVDVALTEGGDAKSVETKEGTLVLRNTGSPKVFLAKSGKYMTFGDFVGQEIAFDLEIPKLVAGTNSALYFVDMTSGDPAKGTGYCDAQADTNSCNEMDIWEGNTISNALTSHSCEGKTCDKTGCSLNSHRDRPSDYGNATAKIDTSKKFTVVTQFSGTDSLSSIKRLYRQNAKEVDGGSVSSCTASGGFSTMASKLKSGMVMAISIWNADDKVKMDWLDQTPMASADDMKRAVATFSNIRYGPIGTTSG